MTTIAGKAHPYDPEVFLAWHNACDCFSLGASGNCWKLVMNIGLTSAGSVVAAATTIDQAEPHPRLPPTASARAWPRCEPASTHFELGVGADYEHPAPAATRYVRKYHVDGE